MKELFVRAWVTVTLNSAQLTVVDDMPYDLMVSVPEEASGREWALAISKAVKAHVTQKEGLAAWVKQYRSTPHDFSFALHFKIYELEA